MIKKVLRLIVFRISGYPSMAIAAIVLVTSTFRAKSSIHQYFELEKNRKELEESVEKVKEEVIFLENEINSIKYSKEYAKKILKGKYHLTEENEKILFFSDDLK